MLTELGADINKAATLGMPLHVAAYSNCCDIARVLVEEYRVDVNQTDSDGATPLIKASRSGADVNEGPRGATRKNALFIAAPD
jgi:ankyrin repeat protein